MLRLLALTLSFAAAPWSGPVAKPPKHAGHKLVIPRPSTTASPAPAASPKPAAPAGKAPDHAGHKKVLSKLAQLKAREMEIWKGLLKSKTQAGFYQLGALRLDIANEQRRLELLSSSQYRKFLQHKAIVPLKLVLGRWGRKARASDGTPYDLKAWTMIGKIQTAIKATVKTPPLPKGQKLFKGRATHYGGEKIYGNEPYPEFHGKPTAIGDTFCMFGQTAAFNRAPLNTWLRVRNPRNSRFVDVRVNDTGPFEKFGVLIDLSRGAYNALGLKDGDKVLLRRIPGSDVVPEPTLCSGRGHAPRSPKHLAEKHFSVPASWR